MPQRLELLDGGTLEYDEAFYSSDNADAIFEQLRADIPWQQERGRMGPFPRLTAWYADAGLAYSYSGVIHEPLAWTRTLTHIRNRVGVAARSSFNSVLLNYYRGGQDSIGYHSDAEPELGINPIIASISLGEIRRFVLKHVASGQKLTFDLAHGSLLVMAGTCQHHWVHGVPKTKAAVGPRINLTFRTIVNPTRLGLKS